MGRSRAPLIGHGFDRVIPNHVIAGCSAWDFQAQVHSGMVIGWVHKPAGLILERQRGRGKMVVTTFLVIEDAPDVDPSRPPCSTGCSSSP